MNKILSGVFCVAATAIALTTVITVDTYAKYTSQDGVEILLTIEMPHYTVHFNANGGTGTMDDQDFEYKTEQALSENTFARQNYAFVKWNTKADGTGDSYNDKEVVNNIVDVEGGEEEITLYAQWGSPMPTVFEHTGVCEFNGEINGVGQPITGDGCRFAGQTYIDTEQLLYSQENYLKDFEIGFKIVEYNSSGNENQATFATAKFESGSENSGNPGFVVRKSSDKIEITQMIRGNQKAAVSFPAGSVTEVKVVRVDEKIYYSINGGDFIQLQSNVGSTDYHIVPMWFGAAPVITYDDQNNMILTPHRFLKAKLSDIYIKVGDYDDSQKHTVTFHAGEGATVNPTEKMYIGDSSMGSMPVPTRSGHAFEGWYTAAEGGTRVRSDYQVTSDMDVYAHWSEDTNICEVIVGGNTIRKESLANCIAAATSGPATITVLADIHENVSISSGQDITFDLGDNVWSDRQNGAVIANNGGTVRIINGTITSSRADAVINNNTSTSKVYISGGSVIAAGTKQAVYNKGGYVEISGDAYLSATSLNRAAAQNLSGGEMVILGGTIESTGFAGLQVDADAGTTTRIGVKDGDIATVPIIRGATDGVVASNDLMFYDGIIMGGQRAINNPAKITDNDDSDGVLNSGTTEIEGVTYYTLYNE